MAKPRDPVRSKQLALAIGNAATLIGARGHCIGALRDDSGRVCLMGAIGEACDALGYPRSLRYDAYDAVNSVLRRANHDLAGWSDQQTNPQVIADLLEGVARKLNPSVELGALCFHAHRVCGECGMAPRCRVEHCKHSYYTYRYGGHAQECVTRSMEKRDAK